eukprot:gene36441-49087_t
MHSIIKAAHYPKNLVFKFVIIDDSKANGLTISTWNNMVAVLFPGIEIETKMWNSSSLPISGALRGDHFEKDVIFVRFYLAEIFSDVQKFIYLDNDIIVTMDIRDMYMYSMDQSCDSTAFHFSDPQHVADKSTDKQSRSFRTVAQTKDNAGRPQNPPQHQHIPTSRGVQPIIGFVMESHSVYTHYIHDHMNVSHPLFVRAIQRFTDKVFLNAGVFLMDANRWRQQNMTARKILNPTFFKVSYLYDTRVGDQAVFYAL